MKLIVNMILVYCLMVTSVFGQATNPSDTLKIGKASSASDKGIIFDTNDGVSNKKLLIEKVSKKLKWDGNSVQIGDGSSSSDKEIIIAGAIKSLKYNGTTGEFEFNDDLKLSGALKTDLLTAITSELVVSSTLRAQSNLKIGTGNNELRVSGGNLEFSNDGSLYKKIGSGSGSGGSSGVNTLLNDSFEDGIVLGWTSSGGTFSQQTYTNGVEGDLKYGRFISTTSGQYVETTAVAIPTSFSGGCQADFKKVNVATAGLFKIQAMDTTGATVYAEQTIGISNWIKVPTISFLCPADGTMVKLRLVSLAAGTIDFDRGYLGSNQNIVNTMAVTDFDWRSAGTVSIGAITTAPTKGTNTGVDNVFVKRVGDTLFASYLYNGSTAGTAGSGDYLFDIPNGYVVDTSKGFNANGGPTYGSAYPATPIGIADVRGASGTHSTCKAFLYSTTKFRVWCATNSSSGGAVTGAMVSSTYFGLDIATASYKITISVPIVGWSVIKQSDIAISPEQSSWFIDANIGGANPSINGSVPSYSELINSSLNLVINTNKGSATAEIPCASGSVSTGLTCSSSSESIGIALTPPSSGLYEACVKFTANATNAQGTYFQLVETPNNSSTIIQEGGQRTGVGFNINTGSTDSTVFTCGLFSFSDTSKRTLRLMAETSGAGTTLILGDRNATTGQRDISITVRPFLSAYNRPILTGDQVTTPGIKNPRLVSAKISNGSTGIVSNEKGEFITGDCIKSSTANQHTQCTLNGFTAVPNCWLQSFSGTVSTAEITNLTVTNVEYNTWNQAGTSAGNTVSIFCHGE